MLLFGPTEVKKVSFSCQRTYETIEKLGNYSYDEEIEELQNVSIIGCHNFMSCFSCSGKLKIEGYSDTCARCLKCNLLQLTKGETSANIIVKTKYDNHTSESLY